MSSTIAAFDHAARSGAGSNARHDDRTEGIRKCASENRWRAIARHETGLR